MKQVIIFEDGKMLRGHKAKLIKRGNKRVLIQFHNNDHEVITEWFKLYIPKWSDSKKEYKHMGLYCHENSNMFYSDEYQTEAFKEDMRENVGHEYFEMLYGDT